MFGTVFDLIVRSSQVYNQVGMFFGAMICLGFGGLILVNSLYWRVHAVRAGGIIIGVTTQNNLYFPVYRYTSQGMTCEAKSDSGSNVRRGKETGRTVPLLISPHNPTEARQANNYSLEMIGTLIIAPGLWLGYTALTAYPITPMTWIIGVALLIYLLERAYRVLIPRGQHLSIEHWKTLAHADQSCAIDLTKVRPIEGLSPSNQVTTANNELQQSRWAVPILMVFAVILLCVGIYQSSMIARLESAGVRAQGEVVRLKEEHNSGHYDYHPIVRFCAANNVTVQFKDEIGSNPPSHRVGDKVTVLYLPDNLSTAIIDRGVLWNWAIPAIVFLFFAGVVGILVWMLRVSSASTPTSSHQVVA
jgi:Protein of unknown function (DUF3592)